MSWLLILIKFFFVFSKFKQNWDKSASLYSVVNVAPYWFIRGKYTQPIILFLILALIAGEWIGPLSCTIAKPLHRHKPDS